MKELTLDTICDGVATELFEHEIKRIIENILDVNTEAEAKRELALIFEFVPAEGRDGRREQMQVTVTSKVKLQGLKPAKGNAYVLQGKAYTEDIRQGNLFEELAGDGVTPLRRGIDA